MCARACVRVYECACARARRGQHQPTDGDADSAPSYSTNGRELPLCGVSGHLPLHPMHPIQPIQPIQRCDATECGARPTQACDVGCDDARAWPPVCLCLRGALVYSRVCANVRAGVCGGHSPEARVQRGRAVPRERHHRRQPPELACTEAHRVRTGHSRGSKRIFARLEAYICVVRSLLRGGVFFRNPLVIRASAWLARAEDRRLRRRGRGGTCRRARRSSSCSGGRRTR